MEGDTAIVKASPEDSATLLKLDGFVFAGAKLTIQSNDPSSALPAKAEPKEEISKEAQELQEKIRSILATRYDTNLKLLNLSALGQDATLVQMGIFDDRKSVSKLFPVLMVVCNKLFTSRQAKQDAIVSVTLTDNQLADVSNVTSLAQTFPDLKNLDLSRNKFADLKALNAWRWRFRHLENLLIVDNPIETLVPDYKQEIVRWYPNLQILNGVQVRSAEEVATTLDALKSPIPIAGPDFRDVGQVGEKFIRQFLVLYDSNRLTLLSTFYDDQSNHSISINMSAPRDPQHSAAIPPWAAYTKHSRNLLKITHLPTRLSRTCRGVQAIQSLWSTLPATRHPDLATQTDKYIIECHPIPGLADPAGQSIRGVDGLMITMHGEFEEENASVSDKALRSFSRTFILGPGPPGGLPIRVVSDLMVLRAWSPLALPSLATTLPNASANNPDSVQQPNQEAITIKLSEVTGMTLNYSTMCLAETGWDLEKAFVAFTANKVCV